MLKGTILYVGGFQLPDKNAAAHRVLNNGKILRDLGYNVVFIDIDKSLDYASDILTTKRNIMGFQCWSLPYPQRPRHWMNHLSSVDWIRKISPMYEDIKFVIAYNYPALALHKLIKYSHSKNIKIISDCTEWYSTQGKNVLFKIIKGSDTFFRMRIVQKKLDGLIVISRYLEEYYSKNKNVIFVPPLVDKDEIKWELNKITANETKKLVYAGEPGKKDNISLLISILAEQSIPFELNIIGVTKNEFIDSQDIIDKNIQENIKFHGRIEHQKVLEYIKQSDFACFFREVNIVSKAGFPTKFVESMSCGTPVITNRTSNLSEYLKDGINGYFIDFDVKGLAQSQMKNILTLDKKIILDMKRYCYETKVFDYRNYKDEFAKIFR